MNTGNSQVIEIRILAGFGLGALNDADEDDLDVYDSGMSRQTRTRMAYDVDEAEDDSLVSIGSSRTRASGRSHDAVSLIESLAKCQLMDFSVKRKPPTGTQTFNDGRLVLSGFVLSDKPVAEDRWCVFDVSRT